MFITSLQELMAPWNEPLTEYTDEEEREYIYTAENIYTGDIIEVKEQTYEMLPESYDEAVRLRSNWVKHDVEVKTD